MENKMENKILRLTTSSLFALQGAFAIFWSLYMYLEDNLRLTEAFVIERGIALLMNTIPLSLNKILMNLLHPPTSVNCPQDIILHIPKAHPQLMK